MPRFFEIEEIVRQPIFKLGDLLPTPRETRQLRDIFETLKTLQSVTVALQDPKLDLGDALALFDALLDQFPDEEALHKYLTPTGQLVHRPAFEAAVRKILSGDVLSIEERQAAEALSVEAVTTTDGANSLGEVLDFAMRVLLKRQNTVSDKKYLPCKFILPTSNLVERFFSVAGGLDHELVHQNRGRLGSIKVERGQG